MIQDRTVCFVSLLLSKSLLWKTQEKNKKARGVHMSFISYLINGISLGSIYAIIALGYTMVYGIAKMLNFAHGDVIMIGCYVVFTMMSGMGMPALPSVIAATAICTVLGVVIEKIAYKPLRKATPLAVLITAIGVSYLLQNIALLIFGADTKILYFCSITSGTEISRWKSGNFRSNSCSSCSLHHYYDRIDAFYQKIQSRSGNVSRIRG